MATRTFAQIKKNAVQPRRNPKKVLLWRQFSNAQWGFEFTDTIHLVKSPDQSLVLYARKAFASESITMVRVSGIRTPADFERAYSRIGQYVEMDDIMSVLDKITLLDKDFACQLMTFLKLK